MKDFKEFLLRGNLVDMAVGVVVGVAFAAVVTALVTDLITPLIAAIGGNPDFSSLTFTINGSHFLYGAFINALIAFVVIAAVVFYLVIKPVNVLMARRAKPEARADDTRVPGVPERDPGRGPPLRLLHRGGALRLEQRRAVVGDRPERVVRDLPRVTVGIDEHARVAAPERRRALARDPRAGRARLVDHRSTSAGERTLCASVTPPQPPPSSAPESSASCSRSQSPTIIPPAWKKTTSASGSALVTQPSAS